MELYQALITLDGWTFLAQICNLMIQLFIFKKFLLNPVNEVKDEIGGMAMEIASKVVEREIKEADHQDLIDEFIKNVGEAS